MLWLARTGTSAAQNAAYDRLHAEVNPPDGRSMAISGEEDELVSVDEKVGGLPLADRPIIMPSRQSSPRRRKG